LIVAVDVESVLATGPILFLVGFVMVVMGYWIGYRLAAGIGAAHMGVCVLFVLLVNILNWSPSAASFPFAWMGLLYTVATAWPSFYAFSHPPSDHIPGTCRQCGYILVCLPEPRCPECGLPFDPREVTTHTTDELLQLARQ